MSAFPSFAEFFHELWAKEKVPFPWQEMLAHRTDKKGWPDAIDLPTASGKTACLDIAVWALAKQAGDEKRSTPRRIWFVVDRRIVVDEAYDRAQKIATALESSDSPAVRAVAYRLLGLRGLPNRRERPLAVGRLRGGVLRDDRWARIPSQPAIITSTVDQLGSRLLFRSYDRSALAAPIFAALAGNDSLILLDEAHCAQPFLQTLRAVQMFRSAKWAEIENSTPFHVAVLSATPPGEDEGEIPDVFPADEDERVRSLNHPLLQARLTAMKRVVLEAVEDEETLAGEIADAAAAFARDGTMRVGVIVNRVARAMDIASALKKMADGKSTPFDVELLTGRIRSVERDLLVGKDAPLHRHLRADKPEALERPCILVSTQCLEVGADFSFDALVTECASLDALRQRFGRLARLGKPVTSHAVIFAAESAMKESDPIYGDALKATWEFLWNPSPTGIANIENAGKKQEVRTVNFGFEALRTLLPPPDSAKLRAMLAPSPDAPILLPAHLDLLCQTAPRSHPDPDIGIFLHGKGRTAAEVRVAFRCDFDPEHPEDWPEIASLCPPVAGEMFSVPLHRFRKWLETRAADTSGDVEGERAETESGQPHRKRGTKFLLCRGRDKSNVLSGPTDIFPDSVILLPAPSDEDSLAEVRKLGQTLEHGFGAEKVDLWELALQHAGKTPALRINSAVLAPWLAGCPPLRELLELLDNSEPSRAELDEAIVAILEWKPETEMAPALSDWLQNLFAATRDYHVRDIARHPGGGIILRAKKQKPNANEPDYFADDDDAHSEAPEEVALAAHCKQVAEIAEKLARACLGKPAALIAKAAGEWHDTGKLDTRFQDMLRANASVGDNVKPLAKSPDKPRSRDQAKAIREASGLPDDFRHEMLSVQLAERFCKAELSPEERELLLHLIASHHGHARPFAPFCEDEQPPAVEGQFDCGSLNLSAEERCALIPPHRVDSGIADRFWSLTRRHGWWGLAYREAILRLADWYASEHPENAEKTTQP